MFGVFGLNHKNDFCARTFGFKGVSAAVEQRLATLGDHFIAVDIVDSRRAAISAKPDYCGWRRVLQAAKRSSNTLLAL